MGADAAVRCRPLAVVCISDAAVVAPGWPVACVHPTPPSPGCSCFPDGTLTPIVKDPGQALLSDSMRAVLSELGHLFPTAFVSGRGRKKLQSLIGLSGHPGLYYGGSHGFDISGPTGADDSLRRKEASEALPVLRWASAQLSASVAEFFGSQVEDNELAVSVHYRNLADKGELPELERRVDDVVESSPELTKHHGKCVFEVRPRSDWHKGKAVEYLLDALDLGGPDVLPVYIGDDVTDEDAFRTLAGRGLGIVVMSDEEVHDAAAAADGGRGDGRRTAATMRLCNTDEVRAFLHCFSEAGRVGRCQGKAATVGGEGEAAECAGGGRGGGGG